MVTTPRITITIPKFPNKILLFLLLIALLSFIDKDSSFRDAILLKTSLDVSFIILSSNLSISRFILSKLLSFEFNISFLSHQILGSSINLALEVLLFFKHVTLSNILILLI